MAQLKPGDKAPDFALPDQHGNLVRLSELVKKHPWVLTYFYPQ